MQERPPGSATKPLRPRLFQAWQDSLNDKDWMDKEFLSTPPDIDARDMSPTWSWSAPTRSCIHGSGDQRTTNPVLNAALEEVWASVPVHGRQGCSEAASAALHQLGYGNVKIQAHASLRMKQLH